MIYDLMLITATVCFGIDCTDIIASLEDMLARWLHKPAGTVHIKKPFSCSLCSTWWCCLAYCAMTGHFTLEGVALSAACALMAKPVSALLNAVRYAGETAAHLIERLLDNLW